MSRTLACTRTTILFQAHCTCVVTIHDIICELQEAADEAGVFSVATGDGDAAHSGNHAISKTRSQVIPISAGVSGEGLRELSRVLRQTIVLCDEYHNQSLAQHFTDDAA